MSKVKGAFSGNGYVAGTRAQCRLCSVLLQYRLWTKGNCCLDTGRHQHPCFKDWTPFVFLKCVKIRLLNDVSKEKAAGERGR